MPSAGTVAEFDESAYRKAPDLTARPYPLEYVSVPYPRDASRYGIVRATLAIFVDEGGLVARVRMQNAQLPPAFERAAVEAFSKAHFQPGRIGDTPVKSRMLVEVEFANAADSDIVPMPVTSSSDKR
jgi:TonB family C-terminal domain